MLQKKVAYLFIMLTLVLAACTPVEPDSSTLEPTITDGNKQEPTSNGQLIYIDSLDVLVMESFPVQVSVGVRGNLANPCVMLNGISAETLGQCASGLSMSNFRVLDASSALIFLLDKPLASQCILKGLCCENISF